jgi:hypothetical protein
MTPPTAVTQKRILGLNIQPLPRLSIQAASKTDYLKQSREHSFSDAELAVKWLNAARAVKKSASYKRIGVVHDQLISFQVAKVKLSNFAPDPQKWNAAVQELQLQRERVRQGKTSHGVLFPGDRNRDTPEGEESYLQLNQEIDTLSSALSKALTRYIFRPTVGFIRMPGTINVLHHLWTTGMMPDPNKGWFQIEVHGRFISEADVALSLVRLYLTGDLEKVKTCDVCSTWLVIKKRHYKFCSPKCSKHFYTHLPDYNERKAKNQRRYRESIAAREQIKKIARAQSLASQWSATPSSRTSMGWKEWVAKAAGKSGITVKWLTRAVNKGELTAPTKPR